MSSHAAETSKGPPGAYTLGTALLRPLQAMTTRLHERLAQSGFGDIRPAHGTVMQHLSLRGSHLTDIATRAQLTKQTIGYLVDDLEAMGYVERVPDPSDARARLIQYTAKGRDARRAAIQALRAIEAEWAAAMAPQHMKQLRALLDELRAVIDAEERPPIRIARRSRAGEAPPRS